MKLFIYLFLFCSALAFASPKVGDYALYDFEVIQGKKDIQGTLEHEIINYDSSTNLYLVRVTYKLPNFPDRVDEEWWNLANENDYHDNLNHCGFFAGTREKITVPAGTFEVCTLPNDIPGDFGSTSLWAFGVPFGGLVHSNVGIGNDFQRENITRLRSFRLAK